MVVGSTPGSAPLFTFLRAHMSQLCLLTLDRTEESIGVCMLEEATPTCYVYQPVQNRKR